ncbi:Sec23/Sec24 trunk domain-containing protein [Zopfochytrium polystomum]|nr:Sec23/Sec24 trunk domain-containing protein [Zopfochytrium polystomum]
MQQQGYGIPNDHQYQRAPTAQYGNPGAPNGQQFGKPAAPRSRIDPNQIPSPLLVQEKDQLMHETNFFSTFSREMPPLASSRFSAVDEGNCNPRFMRLTTYQIPCTDELLTSSMLPLGAVIQPFADLAVTERPLDVVDFGESGPVRCRRCKSYVNPYYQFIDGGRKFVCNLCSADTEVPGEYFCNLDMSGRRMDVGSRPELLRGAVEFKASKEYSSRPATPPSFVFAIDVSYTSMQSGMAAKAAEGLKQLLYGSGKGLPPKAKIGIITFDKAIHFYNMMPMLDQPHMLVVPDVNDIFVPLNEGFLVDPQESRTVIESFLNNLPNLFEGNLTRESAVGAAAQAAYMAMEKQGGHLYIFQTTLPNFGPGALKMREDPSLYGTDKERTLFEPQEFFWRKLGQDCSKDGVCVDLFLFRHSYIDVATLGSLSAITGGDTTYYENFMAERDGIRFIEDLKRSASRSFGFDALMRIRCSDGLKVSHYFGNFHMRNSTDIELAGIDSQKTFAVSFKHDGKLDEKTDTSIQVALLYTSSDGDRRIRVLNLVVPNTTSLGNVFRSADMDTTMNYLAKASVSQAATTLLKTVREQLTDRCVKILTAYRKHCASSSSPGQLILPESFKLYPLYSLSLLKCKAFRGGPDITSDARVFHMRMMKNIPVAGSIALFYPRMVALHNLAPNVGVVENGSVRLPPSVRVSFERLELNGIYIVENGIQMYCWIGRGVLPEVLLKIFGVDKVEAVDPKLLRIPVLDNEYSTRVHAILNQIQADRPNYLPLKLVRYQMDTHLDVEFANFLVEDQNYDSMNYVDYLCFVHRYDFFLKMGGRFVLIDTDWVNAFQGISKSSSPVEWRSNRFRSVELRWRLKGGKWEVGRRLRERPACHEPRT